jgi:hypothetical protein
MLLKQSSIIQKAVSKNCHKTVFGKMLLQQMLVEQTLIEKKVVTAKDA